MGDNSTIQKMIRVRLLQLKNVKRSLSAEEVFSQKTQKEKLLQFI